MAFAGHLPDGVIRHADRVAQLVLNAYLVSIFVEFSERSGVKVVAGCGGNTRTIRVALTAPTDLLDFVAGTIVNVIDEILRVAAGAVVPGKLSVQVVIIVLR